MGSNYGEENNAWISAMNHLLGTVYSAVLKVALELNLFEIIAKASAVGVSASDVASELPTQHPELPRRLDRILCLLASNSLLICSTRTNEDGHVERLYQLSPVGKYFVKDEINGSLAFLATFFQHRVSVDVFLDFKEILLDFDKGLFEKVHGVPFFEHIQLNPTLNNVFHKAMSDLCIIEMNKILETYEGFEEISLLVDVGGGIGQNLNMIISKYPSINGINFDLPHVIQNAPIYSGIKHLEGDMFKSVPKGDAIILKTVLHNWSDEKCIKILSNCYEALPQNGKVIVIEVIVPEAIHSTDLDKMVTGFDNVMLLNGGTERTEKQFENLCNHSGFSHFQVATRVFSTLAVIEFRK
ncbi:isoliquiritigenin 2'-O-methyltransferase [Cajanus cajan]|uniref:Isoliquiritigenin 2'-O-methyltransferase n=1 Tax=Cajanus cajan TaxID=3821 RepID=A0A151SY09_CAJCA|nr:isoliquiritigenin 2'-O-methyltransferase [Cajanus cajan]KYP59696.1 Isoliquiritigenin 2'-O-methyltransferase [Cajanus cajan]